MTERRTVSRLRPAATRRKDGEVPTSPLDGRTPPAPLALHAVTPGITAAPYEDEGGLPPEEMGYLFDEPAPQVPALSTAAPRDSQRASRMLGEVLSQSQLAGMSDGSVRQTLARKLCRLLPELPVDSRVAAAQVALKALEQLARDHASHVRAALASAIKDVACAPPSVVRTLAQDIERSVAEPVLHYCATLTDLDLLEIIAARGEPWALAAIARRERVSAPVSDAIIDRGDHTATGILLDNEGAVIAEPALERLVEDAAERRDWQNKLANRPGLPPRLAVRMAQFVDQSVVSTLRQRDDFDDATIGDIAAAVRRRVDWIESHYEGETPESRAVRLHRMDRLDETAIGDALSWEETAFVEAALSLRAGVLPPLVARILRANNPRAVTALVWRAGLSMRCAMQIQARAAGISPTRMINARNGSDYPLSAEEMTQALSLFGVK